MVRRRTEIDPSLGLPDEPYFYDGVLCSYSGEMFERVDTVTINGDIVGRIYITKYLNQAAAKSRKQNGKDSLEEK